MFSQKSLIKIFLLLFLANVSFAQNDSLEGLLCDEIVKKDFSEATIKSLKAQQVDLNCMCGFESSHLSLKSLLPNYQAGRIFWKKKYKTISYQLSPLQYALLRNKDTLAIALLNAGADPYADVLKADYTTQKINTIQMAAAANDSAGLMLLEKNGVDITRADHIFISGYSVPNIYLERNYNPKNIYFKKELITELPVNQLTYLLQKGLNTSRLKYTQEEFLKLTDNKAPLLMQHGLTCSQINFYDCTAEQAGNFIKQYPQCINTEKSGLGMPLYLLSLSTLVYKTGYKNVLISPMPLDKLEDYRKQGADLSVSFIFPTIEKGEYETYYPYNLYEQAIATNDEALLKYLIEHKVNIVYVSEYRVSPLFMAVSANNLNFVKLLVEGGFDINTKNHDGKTPYKYAKKYGKKEIAVYLKSLKKK